MRCECFREIQSLSLHKRMDGDISQLDTLEFLELVNMVNLDRGKCITSTNRKSIGGNVKTLIFKNSKLEISMGELLMDNNKVENIHFIKCSLGNYYLLSLKYI